MNELKYGFYEHRGEDLLLNVLTTANAKNDKILKPKANQLKISIKAQREKGKATEYLREFLAKEFGVNLSSIELIYGQTSTSKQFLIKQPKKLPQIIGECSEKE